MWVLIRCLVTDFYNSYAGFFLILVLFAFGIMRPIEHIYILQEAAYSPGLLLFLVSLWTAYLLIVCQYSARVTLDPSKHFLQHVILLEKKSHFLSAFAVHCLMMMPVFVYMLATLAMAFYYQQWTQVIILLLFALLSYLPGLIIFKGYGTLKVYDLNGWLKPGSSKINLPSWLFFFPNLLGKHILRLIITKAASLLLIHLTFVLYEKETYDYRLLLSACLAVAIMNSPLLLAYLRFIYGAMSFSIGLPVSRLRRVNELVLLTTLILIPESLLLFMRSSLSLMDILITVLLMVALPALFFSLQLAFPIHRDTQSRRFFKLFVLYFLLIIYSIPPWLIVFITLGLSYVLFFRNCYKYEYIEEK